MAKRYAAIWFPYVLADGVTRRKPALKYTPFVFATAERGRKIITAVNPLAEKAGARVGMVVADAKAFIAGLQVFDDKPEQNQRLLKKLGLACIRYTPIVALDLPDGLLLDINGCAHLWGGETEYRGAIISRFKQAGFSVRMAIADTVGAAWAVARFGPTSFIIEPGDVAAHIQALLPFPPAALRLEPAVLQRLYKLGLTTINTFIQMPRSVLRRRFGEGLVHRLRQALGQEDEYIEPLQPVQPHEERLPCLEPIRTATGIQIAIQRLLEILCKRLSEEGKGMQAATLTGYRIDGKRVQINIATNGATHDIQHLYRLLEPKISEIEPALGIELFVLQAQKVEKVAAEQETLWNKRPSLETSSLIQLWDRLQGKIGKAAIQRFLPDEHHWPERSFKKADSIQQKSSLSWKVDKPRPIRLLNRPEPIEVSAPIPDYPPMNFRYQGKLHQIKKADGPERIEREWWLEQGGQRDYYYVEDQDGQRYWLFRSGHYTDNEAPQWFIHGFFA